MINRILVVLLIFLACSCSQGQPENTGKTDSEKEPVTDTVTPVEKEKQAGESETEESTIRTFDGKLESPPEQWLAQEEIDKGWLSLFDGQTLFGWRATSNANWSVKDGTIVADSGDPGFLMTPYKLKNYQFRCEYRLVDDGNSGIFLRTPMKPTDPSKDCYEFNLCNQHEAFPTGSLVGRQKTEGVTGDPEKWNSLLIHVEGNQITATMNDQEILKFEEKPGEELPAGHIGLQMNGGKIEFRKIALLPLGEKPLFNGEDLSGWNVVPGSKSNFTVKEGLLNVENGTGFLETENQWADFILSTVVRTNDKDLNGGIFYRTMKGTEEAQSNGYELQIHNGFANDDRSQPNDYQTGFGTGAIFRRQKVRWVVPNDNEWFRMTLLAQGPSFYTWVNGLQVVDFTDTRKMDENPRKGQRLEAGHISLQGHDETTNVDFKSLTIIDLAE